MPIYFLFDFKNGDMAAIFIFVPHDNAVLAYISKIVQDKGLVTYRKSYGVSFGTVFFDLE